MDDPEASLGELVRLLDLEIHAGGERERIARQVFLLALIALGDLVLGACPPQVRPRIRRTIAAAEEAFSNPGKTQLEGLFAESTKTYPFGPGEGCYSVATTGVEGCGPGSGCSSGVGTLACQGIPARQIMAHFRDELPQWLEQDLA